MFAHRAPNRHEPLHFVKRRDGADLIRIRPLAHRPTRQTAGLGSRDFDREFSIPLSAPQPYVLAPLLLTLWWRPGTATAGYGEIGHGRVKVQAAGACVETLKFEYDLRGVPMCAASVEGEPMAR